MQRFPHSSISVRGRPATSGSWISWLPIVALIFIALLDDGRKPTSVGEARGEFAAVGWPEGSTQLESDGTRSVWDVGGLGPITVWLRDGTQLVVDPQGPPPHRYLLRRLADGLTWDLAPAPPLK